MQNYAVEGKRVYKFYIYLFLPFLCFLLRFFPLISTPFPLPTPDSPYNALQIKFLCERGVLYFDAPILSFAFASLINLVVRNPILSSKFAASIFASIACFSIIYFAKSVRRRIVDGFFAGFTSLFSCFSLLMAEHLLKNLAAVAFMPLSLALYFYGLKAVNFRKIMLSALFGSLVVFSHTSTASVTGCILTSMTFYFLFRHVGRRKYRVAFKSFVYAVAAAFFLMFSFLIADVITPYYSYEYTSISVEKVLGYVGNIVESPFRVIFKMKPFYEHLIGFIVGFVVSVLLFRVHGITMLVLSLLSVFIASGVVPGSWDIRLILTGYPFYAASIGVLSGYLYDRFCTSGFIKRFAVFVLLCFVIFVSLFPLYYVFASRIRPGIPREMNYAIMSMDGFLRMTRFSLLALRFRLIFRSTPDMMQR